MMIKDIKIGIGTPKLCVSLMGATLDVLLREARLAENPAIDLVEWRADCFDGAPDANRIAEAFCGLQSILKKPLLFTVRTKSEGGKLAAAPEQYAGLLGEVLQKITPDLLDIELSCGEAHCRKLIAAANAKSVATVLSAHSFASTPTDGDMQALLEQAAAYGGDIAKLAVMPDCPADVLRLLAVSERFAGAHPDMPLIAIAMGEFGKISRACGGFFGSAVTFAALEQASAPGQIPFADMRTLLDILYNK